MKNQILQFVFVFLLNCLIPFMILAQDITGSQPLTPLEKVLNPDGTVRLDGNFSGALDMSGWQMQTGPDGKPQFRNNVENPMLVPEDSLWDNRFGYPKNIDGEIYAIEIISNSVYIGGTFNNIVGELNVHHIARLDITTGWHKLGGSSYGTNGPVYSLSVQNSWLYAGGSFSTAGNNLIVRNVAVWNGSAWNELFLNTYYCQPACYYGTSGPVFAVENWGRVVVGGSFSRANITYTNNLAYWVGGGSNWFQFGNLSTSDRVYTIAANDSDIYIGGKIYRGIQHYNGVSWSYLGSGTNDTVFCIAVNGTDVYAGGPFTTAGGISANHIAKWNGTEWSALGSGMNGSVYALEVNGTDLYAGGKFTTAGGISANRIAKWNGTTWTALGTGMDATVRAIKVIGTDIYAGGDFSYLASWNGMFWSKDEDNRFKTVNGVADIRDFEVDGNDLYACGEFYRPGNVDIYDIAKWNGTEWSALGSHGMNNNVLTVVKSGSFVYAGGSFTSAGGIGCQYIARWDGTSWSGFGTEMQGFPVHSLAVIGTDLYAGGGFTSISPGYGNYIAKYNGVQWSGLGSGMNDNVYTLAVNGTDLYAGGHFTTAGGISANRIAKWNGTTWSALGTGMDGNVLAIAVSGTDVYAGGSFTTAGGVSANRIAKWNGTSWSALGSGMNDNVRELAIIGTDLYAAGSFTTAGGVSANYIARWDGTEWSPLGSGLNDAVYALTAKGTELWAGGYFTTAGGRPSLYIARWLGDDENLPVELSSFTANVINNNIHLNWKTETEVSNYGFEVQKLAVGSKGSEWNAIGFVEGNGNTNSPKYYTFVDEDVLTGKYKYRLKQIDTDGKFEYSEVIEVEISKPNEYSLSQNYPNPFNPATIIKYSIPEDGFVTLKVYDVLGSEVTKLVNENKQTGFYEVEFNALSLANGVYYYRLQVGDFVETKKMVLLK